MSHPAALLKARGLHAGKQRGQNFLAQPATAAAIAASCGAGPDDVVVEIGAGLGALTLPLARLARRVVAVEVDRGVFAALQDILAEAGAANVRPLLMDAMDLDWAGLRAEAGRPLLVAGNLPYAISSPLLFSLLENRAAWRAATLMVQREVAARLAASPGGRDYGRLSVLVQTWCQLRLGQMVGPEQFFPRPRVESQVLHLELRDRPLVDLPDAAAEAWFARVVKAAFAQRRKTLANTLAGGLGQDRAAVAAALTGAGIDPVRRAETLSPQELGLAASALGGPPPAGQTS